MAVRFARARFCPGCRTREADASCPPHGFHTRTDCRKVLFASILVTDMGQHFPFVAQLQEMAARLKDHPRTAQEAEEDRLLLCCGLMKCADISNPVRLFVFARDIDARK